MNEDPCTHDYRLCEKNVIDLVTESVNQGMMSSISILWAIQDGGHRAKNPDWFVYMPGADYRRCERDVLDMMWAMVEEEEVRPSTLLLALRAGDHRGRTRNDGSHPAANLVESRRACEHSGTDLEIAGESRSETYDFPVPTTRASDMMKLVDDWMERNKAIDRRLMAFLPNLIVGSLISTCRGSAERGSSQVSDELGADSIVALIPIEVRKGIATEQILIESCIRMLPGLGRMVESLLVSLGYGCSQRITQRGLLRIEITF
jgi:hypothetical protein